MAALGYGGRSPFSSRLLTHFASARPIHSPARGTGTAIGLFQRDVSESQIGAKHTQSSIILQYFVLASDNSYVNVSR